MIILEVAEKGEEGNEVTFVRLTQLDCHDILSAGYAGGMSIALLVPPTE